MEEVLTAPDLSGRTALPKRGGPRSLLPLSWVGRSVRLEYVDAWGAAQRTSGMLLDFGPTRPILNIRGGRTLLTLDCIRLVELVGD
jgi:hypothetical protein